MGQKSAHWSQVTPELSWVILKELERDRDREQYYAKVFALTVGLGRTH